MEFRILGPLEVERGGRPVALGGARQRALLALLLVHANQAVSADRLVEELWGEPTPARAVKRLQVAVTRLRRALDADGADAGAAPPLRTATGGYLLAVAPDELDADVFQAGVHDGREALAAGDPARAAELLRQALALWRGPVLAELAYEPFAQAEIRRLEELRLAALEARVDADLQLGRHAALIAELEALVATLPTRERLAGQLMLALYRSGRQAEALEAYRHAREVLVGQLGIEPGPELRELNQAILVHDPALQAPRATAASASDRRSTLPAPPNRTIGRDHDVGAVAERLRSGSVRLLTLTGAGGVGKTRLALESARAVEADFADGAHFVALAAVTRPQDVPAAIVAKLEIIVLSGESPAGAVERFLTTKHLLLVVDNFEQLLPAAPFIGALLAACPKLTVLATSREPLVLAAEERYPVSPLALPLPGTDNDPETLASVDAVALFSERARAHDPDFNLGNGNAAVVAEICRRLDGLPLAIELAAARCGLLSPRELAERLDASLAGLAVGPRDAPARQQTLRATIDWSYELLSDADKACFAAFAVFAGGATLAAAETITGVELDALDRLVAKSLLVRHQHAHEPTRLAMLETVRAHAHERFAASADRDAIEQRHYRYCVALAQRHGTERALRCPGGKQHLASLDAEIDNLHAALAWAIAQANAERALALAAALGCYWSMRGRYADAVDWVEQALKLPGTDAHPALRVRALCTKARCLRPVGRGAEQPAVMATVEAIARRLGDPVILSQALQLRVRHEINAERLDVADALADEALHWASAAEDDWEIAEASLGKAIAAPSIADLRERVDRAASLLSDVGNVHQLAYLLTDAAYAALCLGSERDATDFAARATPIARALDSRFVRMINSGNLGLAALLTGETDTASHAFREELTLCRETVVRPQAFEGLRGLAAVAVVDGDDKRAATLVGAADAHRYDTPEDPVEARLDETFFEPARTRCGTDTWNAATREGSVLGFEDAIAYALEEPRAWIHAHRQAAL